MRERFLVAGTRRFGRYGYAPTALLSVADEAGVDAADVDRIFVDKEDLFIAVYERNAALARSRLRATLWPSDSWSEQVRVALRAATCLMELDPDMARILLLQAEWVGQRANQAHRHSIEMLASCLKPGRRLASCPADLPANLELLTASGLACLLANRLQAQGPGSRERFIADIEYFVLEPYCADLPR